MLLHSVLIFFSTLLIWASPSVPKQPRVVPVRNLAPRITNGEVAEEGQFPWQVAIFGKSASIPNYLCGGALISEEWVLTAAHCLEGAISATIYAGAANLSSSERVTPRSSKFIPHEDFNSTYLHNDIGLLKLDEPIKLNDNIRPIKLAEEELVGGVNVTISGWGDRIDNDPNPYSPVLNYATVTTIENKECEIYFTNLYVQPGTVCTSGGNPVKNPCLGDSGGPVVANVDEDPVHVAVFSFVAGTGCELPYPAGYYRTAYYREWIREKSGI